VVEAVVGGRADAVAAEALEAASAAGRAVEFGLQEAVVVHEDAEAWDGPQILRLAASRAEPGAADGWGILRPSRREVGVLPAAFANRTG